MYDNLETLFCKKPTALSLALLVQFKSAHLHTPASPSDEGKVVFCGISQIGLNESQRWFAV